MARPRNMSEEESLERALRLFWEKGYERTSLADLTDALEVGPSSIYNAFGSKEALFGRAMMQYMETHAAFAGALLSSEEDMEAEQFATELLVGVVKLYTSKELPQGCAMLQGAGAGSPDDSEACAFTVGLKQGIEAAIRERLEVCRDAEGDLAATPKTLAQFLVATMRGLSQLAVDGASRRELLLVARHAARSCAG
ncbi:MAG: AcrR family transcriptional regulator [Pseudohongiellaceae bacterium]|jgi:AcrR family transcriptional regulator